MSYDAYDIKILHELIWPIFENPLYSYVGKRVSGGSTSRPARIFECHIAFDIPKRNGSSLTANS